MLKCSMCAWYRSHFAFILPCRMQYTNWRAQTAEHVVWRHSPKPETKFPSHSKPSQKTLSISLGSGLSNFSPLTKEKESNSKWKTMASENVCQYIMNKMVKGGGEGERSCSRWLLWVLQHSVIQRPIRVEENIAESTGRNLYRSISSTGRESGTTTAQGVIVACPAVEGVKLSKHHLHNPLWFFNQMEPG